MLGGSCFLRASEVVVGEVGLEPTRTFVQELLRLPWLPLHHSPGPTDYTEAAPIEYGGHIPGDPQGRINQL